MRSPLLAKVLAIAGVVLLVSLALGRIDTLVDERRGRQAEAVRSVERSLAGEQTLIGPLLHRACVEEWDTPIGDGDSKRRVATERREALITLAPQTLAVRGDAKLEPRQRGLFTVHGYAGQLTLQATWPALTALQPERKRADSRLQCGPAILMLAVSDVRGLRAAAVRLDDAPLPVVPGTFYPHYPRGLHVELTNERVARTDAPLTADLTLQLAGTGRLALVPAAAQTTWQQRSDWPHPSFGGRFLPTAREVSGAGFSAQWQVSALASAAAADVRTGAPPCAAVPEAPDAVEPVRHPGSAAPAEAKCLDTLSVAFIDPVNPYVLTDRATKYALLFIALTFGSVMLVEVLTQRRVHPVQYLLVGLALALFFLLLLSLSEHLGFGAAYALAATACVLLLGVYGASMLGRRRAGVAFGAGMALLYGLLWLLRLEQTALVVGSTMLFAMLAATMLLTRRLDWFVLFDRAPPADTPSPAGDDGGPDGPPRSRGEMAVAM
jgi:inner membrane protein